jgi:hypothetical protein
MARHRKYSRKRRGQKRNRMRSRKMRGGFDDEPNMPELRLSDLEEEVEEKDENKKRPSPFDSPEQTKERKRQNIGPKEILRYDDSDIDEDNEQFGGKRRKKRRRTNKRKSRKTRKNRKRRQRGGIVL